MLSGAKEGAPADQPAAAETAAVPYQMKPFAPRNWRATVMCDGALGYRDIPSRAGETSLPYTGPHSTGSRSNGDA